MSVTGNRNRGYLLPMTRWYTSLPISDRLSALLETSRLNGFEHAMAALKTQLGPSSPQY